MESIFQPRENWQEYMSSDRGTASSTLLWAWRHKGLQFSGQFRMKLKFIYPNMNPDDVFDAYHPVNECKQKGFHRFEVLEHDEENDDYLCYQVKTLNIPFHLPRDFVYNS